MLSENVGQDTLKQVGEPEFPVFYMNYNLNPAAAPWRDAIGNAVKYFKGMEYTISRPRDLWFAWSEIMSRIVNLRWGDTLPAPPPVSMRAITFILFLTSACSCLAQQKFNTDSLAPYIPSPQVVVDRMLEAARVRPGETVYDRRSKASYTAAQKFKAYAVGVEISHDLCSATTAKVKSLGLEDKIKIVQGNALRVDLSPADVVTLYLLTSSNEKLKPNLEKYLKPGSRVVSHDFEFRGWTPVDTVKVARTAIRTPSSCTRWPAGNRNSATRRHAHRPRFAVGNLSAFPPQ